MSANREKLEGTTRYDPAEVEARIFAEWIEGGYFHPDAEGAPEENFSVAIPPPNVTGALHMGHALNGSMQDALVRMNRMRGRNALWILGTDHAGIATQAVVEKELKKEGLDRHELGREAFVERVWEWKEEYGSRIVEQYKRLGASLDYERERFTLDEGYVRAVYRVFKQLYDKGYIYRDNYMVNWDPGSRSAISDLEVENREVVDSLFEIDYPVEGSDRVLTVATVRPETMLADTAVAVNPNDERYADLVGQTVVLPLVGRRIPVIADDHVDVEFGTGALKITPGHDVNDFEIGRKHGLEEISVIGEDGRMSEEAGEYAGLTIAEAQAAVVNALRAEGRLRAEEPYTHSVPFSHRSGERIEPLVSLQWFCRMDELAQPAIEVVERDEVRISPAQWKRVYLDWMREIRPWCVSRQLWWGHRIPVWYCDPCEETIVAEQAPERCGGCGGELRQEEDVLDTWFSSALWPFATLGWPDETPELRAFYDQLPHHGARDPLPLGGADGDDGDRVPRRDPVPRRLRALGDPGARRPPHVEEPRDRDRPARGDRRARRRRAALRPAGDVLDPGRALLRRQGRAGSRPGQQALERQPLDPAERGRGGRAGAAAAARRGPLAALAPGADDRLGDREAGDLRLRPRCPGGVHVLLARPLRLVPGDGQAAALRR
jgi:valyl-tRNA synthetase